MISGKDIKGWFLAKEQLPYLSYLFKWLILCTLVGILAGSASAIFLLSLDWVTNYREANLWIIALLPLGGLVIGLTYHYLGKDVVKGNNQLLEEFHSPKKVIPLKMAPLVLFGTLVTHLFGGSAGREGTAVQMGGAIADQFTKIFNLHKRDRKILIITGVSAGFASVFGTPLAGAIFALEVFISGRMRYDSILPSFLAAVIADIACHAWNVGHTLYEIPAVPNVDAYGLLWAIIAGVAFGLAARVFSWANHFWSGVFSKFISYPPLRPVVGGVVLAISIWLMGTTRYIGLGIPVIEESFLIQMPLYAFAIKILLTSFTLGAGFKGGEVTPLFFTGATLGSALSMFIPMPVALLAGMGFVAVFAGATNTPIACTVMAIELFGAESAVYVAMACVMAYLFSGHTGIYSAQIIGSPKHLIFGRHKGKTLHELQSRKKTEKHPIKPDLPE
ncbi:MAG: voltage-gated chloride channel family protein [Cyclobacteriaceae bacterium]|nr:voltage-gated chloride channel family protein [Cyclobacteriaceae bacterium]